ncbi:MAG: GNAT family N-acetyltransferase [Burkholderiales bacterium]|nr:GNAT family N-acetyltransferase [Anaerolineae bacterium]
MSDLNQIVDLELAIWNLAPRDAVPAAVMHPMAMNGGAVIAAVDPDIDHMIGMALAFPVRQTEWMLWSHMTGVHPNYQNRGIGFALKQEQRRWALANGYNAIHWTYDPLQRGNANFNLRILGAVTNTYHVDFYGVMTDSINAGLPSDRVEIAWNLRDERVERLANAQEPEALDTSDEWFLLCRGANGEPISTKFQTVLTTTLSIEIPYDLAALKKSDADLAYRWRIALRETFQTAFAHGYVADDFVVSSGRSWYSLHRLV